MLLYIFHLRRSHNTFPTLRWSSRKNLLRLMWSTLHTSLLISKTILRRTLVIGRRLRVIWHSSMMPWHMHLFIYWSTSRRKRVMNRLMMHICRTSHMRMMRRLAMHKGVLTRRILLRPRLDRMTLHRMMMVMMNHSRLTTIRRWWTLSMKMHWRWVYLKCSTLSSFWPLRVRIHSMRLRTSSVMYHIWRW